MDDDTFPTLGLGTWKNTDPDGCAESVATALDVGYRHVDTAQAYDNEEYVGEGIRRSSVDREDVFLATKVSSGNLAYEDVLESTEKSLDRLGVERVDLLYVHWPTNTYVAEETLPAFDELRDEGKIRHVGVSNFEPAQLEEANDFLDAPIFANQVEMHPLCQQEELVEYARDDGHWLVAYSPLARGSVFDVEEVVEVAEKHDVTPAQVCIAWLLQKDRVAAIPKSASDEHIVENWEAQRLDLDPRDVEKIDSINRTEREVDSAQAPWNW